MIIFDLDDTLYQSESLSDKNTELTKFWIRTEKSLSKSETDVLYEKLPKNHPNPLKGINSIGLSEEDYYREVFRSIDPKEHISENTELVRMLNQIDDEKVIVSFAPKEYCFRVLDALGIRNCFRKVRSASNFSNSKKKAYKSFEEADIVIGNNFESDLRPALELGMDIIHIESRCDIVQEHSCAKDIFAALSLIQHK